MRILVDFTQIPVERTGVGVYAENLVRELSSQLTSRDVMFVLIQKDETLIHQILCDRHNVLVLSLPTILFRNRGLLMLYEQVVMPFPLFSPCPRVVTIHDLTFLLYPKLHTRGRTLVMPFFIKNAMRHAEGLIFVSEATRADAERLIPSTGNLRRIVPLGVDLQGFDIHPQETKSVLGRFSIQRPFVLFVGTLEPRKNVPRLIQAFERIANEHPDLLLVLAGKPGWDFDDVFAAIHASKYKNRIRHLGFVGDSEKRALLVACEALVYPSLYEGFGLPVLEAMAAGAPVITSNVSSLPEVAGDAAMLVNPLSVDDIADALRTIVSNT